MLLIRFQEYPRLQDDHAVGPPLDRDIAFQPFDLAKGRFCQNRGCIPAHVSLPTPAVSSRTFFLILRIHPIAAFIVAPSPLVGKGITGSSFIVSPVRGLFLSI